MSGRSWAASGRRRDPVAARRAPRPLGSWGAAVDRARETWDGLTGGPLPVCSSCGERGGAVLLVPDVDVLVHRAGCDAARRELVAGRYSDAAAAAILSTALGLWADTAAALGEGLPPE